MFQVKTYKVKYFIVLKYFLIFCDLSSAIFYLLSKRHQFTLLISTQTDHYRRDSSISSPGAFGIHKMLHWSKETYAIMINVCFWNLHLYVHEFSGHFCIQIWLLVMICSCVLKYTFYVNELYVVKDFFLYIWAVCGGGFFFFLCVCVFG